MTSYQVCPVAKMEKILLATDGSKFSEGAVREAINLAKTCSSKLYVISVAKVQEITKFADTYPLLMAEKLETAIRQHLELLKESIDKEGIVCETIKRRGEPYQCIVDEAAKNNVEMIIMGRHGRTGLMRLMMGSVTARTIGHAPCNVLVVPRAAKPTFKKILIATDGSIFSELASREAISIAKYTGGSLIALSVVDVTEEFLAHAPGMVDDMVKKAKGFVEDVKKMAEGSGVNAETFVREGEAYKKIIELAREHKADVIFTGSHGRTALKSLLMGSVTERVIGHAECAILVVRKP